MRGQGGSSEGESRPPDTTFLNPVGGLLANLFGIPTSLSEGGIRYGGRGADFMFAGADPSLMSGLSQVGDFLTMESPYSQWLTSPDALEDVASGLDLFGEAVVPSFEEMVTTGAPVDVEPLVRRGMTDVAESLSPLTGLYSSDLAGEALRTASELRVGAEEAAMGRRADALAMSPLVMGGGATVADQLLGLGEAMNLGTTGAGRAVAMLQLLAGLQPTGAVPRGNVSENSAKSGGGGILWA